MMKGKARKEAKNAWRQKSMRNKYVVKIWRR